MAQILIVDDEPDVRDVLAAILGMQGHEVTEAESGLDALEKFDPGRHELVVSDVMMPDMNGFALLTELGPRLGDRIPFLILSSHDDPDGVEAAIYAGAFDYLTKPFIPAKVAAVVERALAEAAKAS